MVVVDLFGFGAKSPTLAHEFTQSRAKEKAQLRIQSLTTTQLRIKVITQ